MLSRYSFLSCDLPISPEPSISYHGTNQWKKVGEHRKHVVDDCGTIVGVAQLISQVQRQDGYKKIMRFINKEIN